MFDLIIIIKWLYWIIDMRCVLDEVKGWGCEDENMSMKINDILNNNVNNNVILIYLVVIINLIHICLFLF